MGKLPDPAELRREWDELYARLLADEEVSVPEAEAQWILARRYGVSEQLMAEALDEALKEVI